MVNCIYSSKAWWTVPYVSLFITKRFHAAQNKNNFHQDRDVTSMLYFIPFSLKIRLLSPELFSSVLGKGLCDGLLTKRFTTMRNLTCKRECRLLSIFTSTPVIQCLSRSGCNYCSWNSFHIKTTAHWRNLPDEDNKSKLICGNDRCACWRHRNRTRMKIMMRKNNHHHQGNANTLGSGDCCLRLTRHMSICLQVVTEERSRKKHHTYVRIHHLSCNLSVYLVKYIMQNKYYTLFFE
jgi:hypothetical protein